jgi:hypothetical protein
MLAGRRLSTGGVGGDFMKPPIGFIPLREAADLVGLCVEGSDWRRLDEVDADNVAYDDSNVMGYYVDPRVDGVIEKLAKACERGEIVAAYRSVTGAGDDLPRAKWHSPAWRTYFATGMIDLDLPLLGDGNRPTGTGTARCAREVFLRRDDLDRFIAKLHAEQAIPESKAKTSPFNERTAKIFVSEYLKRTENPTLEDLRAKAKGRGNRPQIDAEYRRQMHEKTGRPIKQGPRSRNPRGKSAEK